MAQLDARLAKFEPSDRAERAGSAAAKVPEQVPELSMSEKVALAMSKVSCTPERMIGSRSGNMLAPLMRLVRDWTRRWTIIRWLRRPGSASGRCAKKGPARLRGPY
eukprot:8875261-Pyramimonas_sp.AAC.1